MPSNYETIRDYNKAMELFLEQVPEEDAKSGERFFEWLHREYVPPRPKPLSLSEQKECDIAHTMWSIFSNKATSAIRKEDIMADAEFRNFLMRCWIEPSAGVYKRCLWFLEDAGLVSKTAASGRGVKYLFASEPDDAVAYRSLANVIRKRRGDAVLEEQAG